MTGNVTGRVTVSDSVGVRVCVSVCRVKKKKNPKHSELDALHEDSL